jgi:hypothetical protein
MRTTMAVGRRHRFPIAAAGSEDTLPQNLGCSAGFKK